MADTQLVMNILAKDEGAAATLGRVAAATDRIDSKVSETNSVLSKMGDNFKFAALEGKGMVAAVGGAIAALPLVASVASAGIVTALGGGLAGIGIKAAAESDKVKTAFKDMRSNVTSSLQKMAKPFEPVLVRIAGMIEETFKAFKPAIGKAFKQMAPAIEDFAGQVSKGFKQLAPAIGPITDAFTKLLNKIGPKLPGIFKSISGALIKVANAVSNNSGMFVRLVQVIGSTVAIGLKLFAWLTKFPGVAAGIIVVLGIVAAAFGGPVTAIAGVVAAIVGLVTLVIAYFPQIKAAIITAWKAVKNFTVSAWNAVVGWITSAASSVWNAVTGAFNGIVSSVSNAISSVIGWVAGLPGRIVGALGDLGSLLWNAGKDILRGLWNGIKSMAGWVKNQIMGLVRSIVPGPVADVLGIASPSKVMAGLGKEVGRGLAVGMTDSAGEVRNASGALAAAATVQPDQVAMGGMAAARNAGSMASGARARREAAPTVRVEFAGDEAMKKWVRRVVRVDGHGSVQAAFGS